MQAAIFAACVIAPSLALAQAAVQSDTPVPHRGDDGFSGVSALPPSDEAGDNGLSNPVTGPGSPGTTGTGAAGTGPSGTMAALGR